MKKLIFIPVCLLFMLVSCKEETQEQKCNRICAHVCHDHHNPEKCMPMCTWVCMEKVE